MQPNFQGLIPPEDIIRQMNKMEDAFYKQGTASAYNRFTKLARRDEVDAVVDHLCLTDVKFRGLLATGRPGPRPCESWRGLSR